MLNFLDDLNGHIIIASFSGAMLFTVTQRSFQGKKKAMAFTISFLMGNIGADTTAGLIKTYVPEHLSIGGEVGAFICSALIVTVAMQIIFRVEDRNQSVSKVNASRGDL
ncbi:putative holin [Erwinia persicina]|uniref:putative holin n=1 Tax=Erwinia persicina TaxID=55211 RepID=UPI001FCEC4DB|nr:putative holin [Erwinia persicina]